MKLRPTFSSRVLVVLVVAAAVAVFYGLGGAEYLRLAAVQRNLQTLKESYAEAPVGFIAVFLGVYLFLTTLSIPGSIVLTLLAGAVMGPVAGTFWVMLAVTLGASASFLLARYLFRDFVRRKFRPQYERMNRKIEAEGLAYLFTLRMIPVSPYVVINLVMGLTRMKLSGFAWVTFLGMLPGTFLYVLAGEKLAGIDSPGEIISWEIGLLLLFLGLAPPVVRSFLRHHSRRLAHE